MENFYLFTSPEAATLELLETGIGVTLIPKISLKLLCVVESFAVFIGKAVDVDAFTGIGVGVLVGTGTSTIS